MGPFVALNDFHNLYLKCSVYLRRLFKCLYSVLRRAWVAQTPEPSWMHSMSRTSSQPVISKKLTTAVRSLFRVGRRKLGGSGGAPWLMLHALPRGLGIAT